MVVYGWWEETDRGVSEPRVVAAVHPPGGCVRRFEFLVDSGADRTFLPRQCAEEFGIDLLALPLVGDAFGVGSNGLPYYEGEVRLSFRSGGGTVEVATEIGVFRDEGVLDLPALGRDVLDLFTVILDRRRDVVALLEAQEPYEFRGSPCRNAD